MADVGQRMEDVDMNYLISSAAMVEDLSGICSTLHLRLIRARGIDDVYSARDQSGLAHTHPEPAV